ncbi:hypothetical protein GZD23_004132 [Salmonella enterica subsp. enterica]|nr:hypothetical protein [Salmonella enterica subsp. enterica serovar Nima]EEI4748809.1 hypothetical protein [Salmonella enterica]
MLRQPGRKPAAPQGPGRDSAAGSVRSMTAPVPVREVARFDIYYFIYNE